MTHNNPEQLKQFVRNRFEEFVNRRADVIFTPVNLPGHQQPHCLPAIAATA